MIFLCIHYTTLPMYLIMLMVLTLTIAQFMQKLKIIFQINMYGIYSIS